MKGIKYVIYLTGNIFDEYISAQKYLESKNKIFTKPALGMHCTILRFYSVVDEDILIKEFNNLCISLYSVSTQITKTVLFDDNNIVLQLDNTSILEKLHRDTIRKFNPFEIITSETRYVGSNYTPHITIGQVSNNYSIPNKLSKLLINKNIILDTIVFVKAESDWTILAEKKL
ncbi:MAG: 2'-5' RNA ligase family protein [Candidatus Woesearchaeota archaeon]